MMLIVQLAGLLLLATPALSAYRCVGALVDNHCPVTNVYPTVQAAIDAAGANDSVVIGRGVYAERITVRRPMRIKCRPGVVITDVGLAPGTALVTYSAGQVKPSEWDFCAFEVSTSEYGFLVPSTVTTVELKRSSVTRLGGRKGTGILIDGAGVEPYAKRTSLTRVAVTNFAVGVHVRRAKAVDIEPVEVTGCGIGVLVENSNGQMFFNTISGNGIGFVWHGPDPGESTLGAFDTNGNVYVNNHVGVLIGLGLRQTEFSHDAIAYKDGQVAFRVEVAPGVFTEGDTAYRNTVACQAQFGPIVVNGTQYEATAFNVNNACSF